MQTALDRDGFEIIPAVLDSVSVENIIASLEREWELGTAAASRRGNDVYAMRNLLSISRAARDVARSAAVRNLVEPLLGTDCAAVRGILFDKTPDANWNVVWHQDLSLAVRERYDLPGWGPWSVKAGTIHVQPPAEILGNMLTVRLHLDTCDAQNGPLRTLPGTHKMGRIAQGRIADLRRQTVEQECLVLLGGALLMRPLLLHASSEARTPGHRRVLHFEFAAGNLPKPLEWVEQIRPITQSFPDQD